MHQLRCWKLTDHGVLPWTLGVQRESDQWLCAQAAQLRCEGRIRTFTDMTNPPARYTPMRPARETTGKCAFQIQGADQGKGSHEAQETASRAGERTRRSQADVEGEAWDAACVRPGGRGTRRGGARKHSGTLGPSCWSDPVKSCKECCKEKQSQGAGSYSHGCLPLLLPPATECVHEQHTKPAHSKHKTRAHEAT